MFFCMFQIPSWFRKQDLPFFSPSGEHIDYCGYGVLPMAITPDIVIAASTDESDNLTLANHVANGKFP